MVNNMKNERLEKYSEEVQKKVRSVLSAYDECHIERHGSEYIVCTGWCLKNSYEDEEILDTFKKEEIFTEDEIIENYINSFHDYPINYKGKRNYQLMNMMDESRRSGKELEGHLDEGGNFTL